MIKKILQILVNNLVWYSGLLISYMSKRENKTTKTLCIVRTDAIGDFVLFTASIKYLREKYDDFNITLIIQSRIEGLAENCPYIDTIVSFNEKKYRRNLFYKFCILHKLYRQHFSLCLNPVFSRERIIEEMVLWSNASEKIGWNTESPNMTPKEKERGDKIYTHLIKSNLSRYDHELKRNKEFLEHLGIEVRDFSPINYYGEKEKEKIEQLIKKYSFNKNQMIALIPGALSQYRQWSASNWKKLITEIIKITGNPKILIVGSKNDENIIQINGKQFLNNHIINLCGKLALNELPPLFEKCTLVIGNETGPMHIAIATGVKTITILGGGHFGRFMPYGNEEKTKLVYKKMACFQCNWQCIYPEKRCITEIRVKEVFDEVKKLLISENNYTDREKITLK